MNNPELIKKLSQEWNIPINFIFIASPGDRFPYKVAELSGVRLNYLIKLKDTNKKACSQCEQALIFVGAAGFEPAAPWSQTRCATGLRHAPNNFFLVIRQGLEPRTLSLEG